MDIINALCDIFVELVWPALIPALVVGLGWVIYGIFEERKYRRLELRIARAFWFNDYS